MISRTSRKRLIRSGAGALIAVVLPAAECWASWADDGTASSPDGSAVAAAPAADDAQTDAAPSRRFKLPSLPRPFRSRRQALSAVKFPGADAGQDAQAAPVQAAPPPPAVPDQQPSGTTTIRTMPAPPSPSLPPPPRAAQAAVAALNYSPAATVAAPPLPPASIPSPVIPASPPPAFTAVTAPSAAGQPQPSGAASGGWDLDEGVERTGCATCGGFHSMQDGAAFHASFGGCADGMCIPGRPACSSPGFCCDTVVGEFMNNLYQCLCCPDPCYQPGWVPAANASFFADYARPWTVTRIRFDRGIDMLRPDRNQFFLKTTNPSLPKTFTRGGRMFNLAMDPSLDFSQLALYQEAAGEKGSVFVEYPYRQINPQFSPTQAGFGDINFGVKSLLYDCEMLQVAFQFRTYAPTGRANAGLGTGHFSLEPSILASLKLAADTYFQAQVAQWIPLGGTQNIRGGVLTWFMSLNQVVWWCTPQSPLIATLEMDGWSFQNGGWTVPITAAGMTVPPPGTHRGVASSGGGVSYFNIGPGLRMSLCNRVDFGGAITWSTTTARWADPWFRFEVRFLF